MDDIEEYLNENETIQLLKTPCKKHCSFYGKEIERDSYAIKLDPNGVEDAEAWLSISDRESTINMIMDFDPNEDASIGADPISPSGMVKYSWRAGNSKCLICDEGGDPNLQEDKIRFQGQDFSPWCHLRCREELADSIGEVEEYTHIIIGDELSF